MDVEWLDNSDFNRMIWFMLFYFQQMHQYIIIMPLIIIIRLLLANPFETSILSLTPTPTISSLLASITTTSFLPAPNGLFPLSLALPIHFEYVESSLESMEVALTIVNLNFSNVYSSYFFGFSMLHSKICLHHRTSPTNFLAFLFLFLCFIFVQ